MSSSERTPLLGTALGDDLNNRIGFSRALGIAVFMGLLIFIQSMILSSVFIMIEERLTYWNPP